MKTLLLNLTLILLMFGCKQTKNTEIKSLENKQGEKEIVDSGDSLIVMKNTVIFLMPDTTEINKMQSEYDEEVLAEIVADMTWYPGIAGEILDSFKIDNRYSSKKYLILRNKSGKQFDYKRKEIEGDMILFNTNKEPVVSYSIDFDRDATLKYFDIKK